MEIVKFIFILQVVVTGLVTGLVTFFFNFLFYRYVKRDVDRSIEEYKIVHSGVFKEKLDIYKELLGKILNLEHLSKEYYKYRKENDVKKFNKKMTAFIKYYSINKPFLSKSMLETIEEIQKERQNIFFTLYYANLLENKRGISNETKEKAYLDSAKAGNKLKEGKLFSELETKIIDEMRADLKTDNYKKEKKKKRRQ